MIRYALNQYIPKRYLSRASFAQQDISRRILGFKDGRNVYTRWAARQVATALSAMDMTDVTVVCIPASSRSSHVRRWKRFSQLLCQMTGAKDGFSHVDVNGSRMQAHTTGVYELAENIEQYVHIDRQYFHSRKVLLIDDIYTTGRTASAFADALSAAGAEVVLSMFLARTVCSHAPSVSCPTLSRSLCSCPGRRALSLHHYGDVPPTARWARRRDADRKHIYIYRCGGKGVITIGAQGGVGSAFRQTSLLIQGSEDFCFGYQTVAKKKCSLLFRNCLMGCFTGKKMPEHYIVPAFFLYLCSVITNPLRVMVFLKVLKWALFLLDELKVVSA